MQLFSTTPICAATLFFSACCCAQQPLEPLLRDDFSGRHRYELQGRQSWDFRDGACRVKGSSRELTAIARLDELEHARIEVRFTPQRRAGASYDSAGVALRRDANNDWRLLLVEGPDHHRYFELIEHYAGVHQAQVSPGPTRLTGASEGNLAAWQYGAVYQLTLTLSGDSIVGEVKDADGRLWRRSYSLASGQAIRCGRPALFSHGMDGEFRQFNVAGVRTPPMPGLATQRGPQGSAAILSQDGAEGLRGLFERAGFGVTTIRWDDLGRGRLPAESLDLLVLADARRLPAAATDAVTPWLAAGGKLLAIGAPAFGELLLKSPAGWTTRERYDEELKQRVTPRPVHVELKSWKRNARDPQRAASIADEDGAFKISCDLDGWDGRSCSLENPFTGSHTLTVFRARGDANTSQLAIEWAERDGARWIARVELTPEWRTYLLRSCDFRFWHDSPVQRGAGASFNPPNAARLVFVLAPGGHTPDVRPGPHTFWVKDIGTAAEPPGAPDMDLHVPDIEGVSPSYMLHALDESATLRATTDQRILPADWKLARPVAGYSPNEREGGRGIERGAPWRWLPVIESLDASGRNRGALVSLFIGNETLPDALWANVAVAEPADALTPPLADAVVATAKAMTRGCFLLEGGSEFFSYHDGEAVQLGALALNAGRQRRDLTARVTVTTRNGKKVFQQSTALALDAGTRERARWTWKPDQFDKRGCVVTTELLDGETALDSVRHEIDFLPPPGRDFARVEGSNFIVGGKKWFMRGINYWPNYQGGRQTVPFFQREYYDPAIIERDLTWLESLGVNFLTGIQAPQPADPGVPGAFRDLHDFLNRCQRHGMKVFFFLHDARPLAGADFEKTKACITAAGIKDHPAILSWELAWEPIFYAAQQAEFLKPDWNAWTVERYGSVANAETDWGCKPERDKEGRLLTPSQKLCTTHGPHDRMVAAFRRFFSDRLSRGYADIVRPLRAWDPNHLITFRFGACGIPNGGRFAHAHSAGVAKHVDFMCPEGYDLQPGGPAKPSPADDIRKGGLVTLYYRFASREKPVVWMEFGYSASGMHTPWQTPMVRVAPEELARQRNEFENFYSMFLESGARGACPWWMPGGFRLDEDSDFGVLNPDGTERPAVGVMRRALPQFARVRHPKPTTSIEWDSDTHNAEAWQLYSQQYLDAIKAGRQPYLKTAGTGTDSANTPLLAVGNVPCNGHNPPKFLNAEFNSLEIKEASGKWQEVVNGATIAVKRGAPVRCRASVGNLGEAKWLAPRAGLAQGSVYLAGRKEYGMEFKAPIAADTGYLADGEVTEFTLIPAANDAVTVSFEMLAEGRAHFGERRIVTLRPVE